MIYFCRLGTPARHTISLLDHFQFGGSNIVPRQSSQGRTPSSEMSPGIVGLRVLVACHRSLQSDMPRYLYRRDLEMYTGCPNLFIFIISVRRYFNNMVQIFKNNIQQRTKIVEARLSFNSPKRCWVFIWGLRCWKMQETHSLFEEVTPGITKNSRFKPRIKPESGKLIGQNSNFPA